MFRKRRALAGLLAALAMIVSFGEAVWASTCAPPAVSSAFGPMAMTAPLRDEAAPATNPSDHDHRAREASRLSDGGAPEATGREMSCCVSPTDGSAPSDTPCPFDSPLASQTCAGLSALASAGEDLPDPIADRDRVHSRTLTLAHLTAAYVPFRPPRA